MALPATNLLLDLLPPAERNALQAKLQPVSLPVNTVLYEAGETPRYGYFLTSGVASVVTAMSSGEAVEVGLNGREGVVGSIHLLGGQTGSMRCFMQVGGSGLRVDFRLLQDEFFRQPGLLRRTLQYVQYQTLVLTQLSACNRIHEVQARLARWVLMISDRVDSPAMDMTQEFLGAMLGARRSTVTVAVNALQDSALIERRRGHLQIVDRPGLEKVACECYQVTLKLLQHLYGT